MNLMALITLMAIMALIDVNSLMAEINGFLRCSKMAKMARNIGSYFTSIVAVLIMVIIDLNTTTAIIVEQDLGLK